MSYANNKDADQPEHPRSLISVIVIRCLDSIMPLVSISEISSLQLASVAAQACLSLTWSQTPEDRVSHDVAHFLRKTTVERSLLYNTSVRSTGFALLVLKCFQVSEHLLTSKYKVDYLCNVNISCKTI